MDDKKKKAAIAGVMHYLAMEQAQAVGAPAPEEVAASTAAVAIPDRSMLASMRPWGLSGRQAQMQMRTMVQMKAFK